MQKAKVTLVAAVLGFVALVFAAAPAPASADQTAKPAACCADGAACCAGGGACCASHAN